MFTFFYQLFLKLVLGLLHFIGLFFKKINLFLKERESACYPNKGVRKYWIHCASLGEFEMAIPLIKKLLIEHDLSDLVITFFSPSGYKQAIKGKYSEAIMYLPFDTRKNVQDFYKNYSPSTAIFVRYDFWFNYINEGLKQGVKFYLINGRFTHNHFIFKWFGVVYKQLLQQFEMLFVSDKISQEVLARLGFNNVQWTGDTRFDRVAEIAAEATDFKQIDQFKGAEKLIVFGSSWPEEEEFALKLAKEKREGLKILIAPHDIKRSDEILEKFKEFKVAKYSDLQEASEPDILIIDNIGMLSRIYRYADFAFIGGGFSGKLHNILEPAVWGCPLFYGPRIDKFPEANDFIEAGFGFIVNEEAQFLEKVTGSLNNPVQLIQVIERSKKFANGQIGATEKIYESIN